MTVTQTKVTDISALAGLDLLWSETKGNSEICVAILDGPVDQSHPCFNGANLRRLPTLVSDKAGTGLMSSHGTHITSVIFGQHGSPITGIAPNCRGLIVPVFSDAQRVPLSQLDLARAINQAVEAGAHVINISGGQLSQSPEADQMLTNAVRFCNDNGVLIVSAAGNDGCPCLHVPAALPSVLAVGAMNAQRLPFDFSNWGETYQKQGVLASGEDILGAVPGGGTILKSGTSFATPIISGIVALLLSIQRNRGETPNPQAIRDAILKSALQCDPELGVDCDRFLVGSLNIPGAYALIQQGGSQNVSKTKQGTTIIQPSEASHPSQGIPNQNPEVEMTQPSTTDEGARQDLSSTKIGGGVQAAATTISEPPPAKMSEPTSIAIQVSEKPAVQPSGVVPAACGCNSSSPNQLVYAIGVLGYDFGTEARRDGFTQLMPQVTPDGRPFLPSFDPPEQISVPANVYDAKQMIHYLAGYPYPEVPFPTAFGFPQLADQPSPFPPDHPAPPVRYPGYPAHISDAAKLIWTLNIELTSVYALKPMGGFASEVYKRFVEYLAGQILHPTAKDYVSRVSIPGVLTGETVKLFSGQIVPVIIPQLRGMYAWNVNQLIETVLSEVGHTLESEEGQEAADSLRDFLNRIYYDLRNLGQTSAERALNYSATNAFQAATILVQAQKQKLELDTIIVEKSTFCRMDSDCWDVKLKFFSPDNVLLARKVFRFTIDVSEEFPVTMGPVRAWSVSG